MPRLSRQTRYLPYFFLAPFFIGFSVFVAFRLVFAFYIAFTDWNLLHSLGEAKFVGLGNFERVLQDSTFWFSVRNAFIYVLYEPIAIFAGFFLALVLNRGIRGRNIFTTAYFLPIVVSVTSISFVWGFLYSAQYGPINDILRRLGLPPQPFLNSPTQALPSIMGLSIWQYMGLNAVIFLAGLQSIPREYFDAARVYGARRWKFLRHVTIPLLKPAFLFVAITATAGALQVFTEVYVMTLGGPAKATYVPVLQMYFEAFNSLRFGYASALGIAFFAIIFGIVLLEIRLMRRGGMAYY